FGWLGQNVPNVPGPDTVWSLTSGATLAPGRPVTLTHDNGAGLRFTRVIEVDEQYMFTITDTVANLGTAPITLAPYGSVQRHGLPQGLGKQFILHEGAIGAFGAGDSFTSGQKKYGDWAKDETRSFESTGGWLGITDKYWMAALIPDQSETIDAEFRVRRLNGVNVHETNMLGEVQVIQPG